MKRRDVVFMIGLAALVASCRTTEPSPTVFRHKDAADLFGVDHVPRFEFSLPDDQWEWLQANAADKQDVRAQTRYEGQPAGVTGLRFKGSVGTLARCFDKTGKLICPKLSLSLDFEKYDSTNRFFGLKRLNLHSMVADPTKLHERMAYDLYRLSGVKAPRSSWANVSVNGKSYGLFSMVEEVDGDFTADRWPADGHGNLYKEVWPRPAAWYAKAAKATDTHASGTFEAFANELANSSSPDLPGILGKWTDLPYLARYMAVDDAIANCDGITAMYAAESMGPTSNNHNFYIYQEQHRDIFWLIPWDMDLTLTPCADFAAVPRWNTPASHCDRRYPVWGTSWVEAPGCDRLFQALATDRADYQSAVDQLLAGPFSERTLLKKIEHWSAFIRDSEVADPKARGEESWISAIDELKRTIPVLRDRLIAFRHSRPLIPLSLSLTSNNDFEGATSLDAQLAFPIRANVNSQVSQEVRTSGALDGDRDIRLTFVYRDPSGLPASGRRHWIYYPMRLTNGFHDLTDIAHVRLLLRTDQPRTVRIELESDLYRQPDTGSRFGWDVVVTNSPTAVDLVLDNATLPTSAEEKADALRHVRTDIRALSFHPAAVGRNESGMLGAGRSDRGYLEIDDVRFSKQ